MAFNPQTVKFVTDTRQQLAGYIQMQNTFCDAIRNMKAQAIDGTNAPTQEDLDEVNRIGAQNYGSSGYVPVTLATWGALVSAMTGIFDPWNGGQNTAFLNAKP